MPFGSVTLYVFAPSKYLFVGSTIANRYCEPMPGSRIAIAGVMPVTP